MNAQIEESHLPGLRNGLPAGGTGSHMHREGAKARRSKELCQSWVMLGGRATAQSRLEQREQEEGSSLVQPQGDALLLQFIC